MINFKSLLRILAISSALTAAWGCNRPQTTVGRLTSPLDDSAWDKSTWISAADAPVVSGYRQERAADGASWFGTEVTPSKKVIRAVWMTTGLGVYELYVNEKLIGEEILKPGFTHYAKTKRSFTYDITDAFITKAGASNKLAVQVTPGWWADKIITPGWHDGMVGKKCAFRGVLELSYADGTTELLGSGVDGWTAGIAGRVKHAAIFDGEEYDARQTPGYQTVFGLGAPEINEEFNGEILPTAGAEIYLRKDIALSPVKAYTWEGIKGNSDEAYGTIIIKKEFTADETMTVHPGETLVVDFGQNCAAVPAFVFDAAEGTTLTCLPAELLNDGNGAQSRGMDGPEGSVHRLNLRVPDSCMRLEYTFASSKKPVDFLPRCTFFGYRFVSITATDDVTIYDIKSIPVTSITKEMETGTITTGNELVNKLISNTLWGQRSNYLSVTTDCPQRNERLGWTADTQVFAETGTFFANTDSFFHKWLRDLRDTQSPLGGYPGVAPLAQYGAEETSMMRVGWADAGVIVPWTVWKQFADKSIIEDSWESMEKFMDHVAQSKYDHNALKAENGNSQWADWLSYEPLESRDGNISGPNGVLPDAVAYWNYLGASYWVIDAGMMADMARASDRDYLKYEQMQQEAIAYIRDKFMTRDGRFKTEILNTMQTPALFALKNGIVTGEAEDKMIENLRENFKQHGNCLQTGFLGTSILMSTLTNHGMADIAYELLFQRKNPSWLYSVDNGATTMWERWNSYTLESGMGPKGMNSFNHYAYGCVCQWIWETAAGIAADPKAPGFNHIIMAPIPDKRLGSICAEYKSAAGLIKSEWHYEGETWVWNFIIPQGASASVTVPGSDQAQEYSEGSYTVSI